MISELRARLFWKCLIAGSVHFQDYKLLAEWLGCYNYVLPSERTVLPALQIHLAATLPTRKLIHTLWHVEAGLSSEDQQLLYKE